MDTNSPNIKLALGFVGELDAGGNPTSRSKIASLISSYVDDLELRHEQLRELEAQADQIRSAIEKPARELQAVVNAKNALHVEIQEVELRSVHAGGQESAAALRKQLQTMRARLVKFENHIGAQSVRIAHAEKAHEAKMQLVNQKRTAVARRVDNIDSLITKIDSESADPTQVQPSQIRQKSPELRVLRPSNRRPRRAKVRRRRAA